MKKFIAFIIIFILPFVTVGCEERSIEENLEDLGYLYFCSDKKCHIFCYNRGEIGFTLAKDEDNEYSYYFNYRINDINIYYYPIKNYYVLWGDDYYCTYNGIVDNDCPQGAYKFTDETNKVYERELRYLDLTEKEFYDYFVDLYSKNFIQ